jgi:hypothetical protein
MLRIESNDLDGKKLLDLREVLAQHKAFSEYDSKLENFAVQYNISIKWIPKFHYELNPIEGLWCYLKQYVVSIDNYKETV